MPTFNFAGVPDQVEFTPLPAGEYTLELQDYKEGTVKNGDNKGATMYSFTYEVVDNEEEKYNGRKVWDNLTILETTLWRVRAMLKAFGADVPDEGDFDVEFDDFIGEKLVAKLKVRPARKVGDNEYEAKNEIRHFQIPETADAS